MDSPPSSVCGICSLRNLTKKSEVWCPECDEGLCSHCMEHHSLSKLSRDHITVPVTEYLKLPKEVVEISLFCKQHHEKYQTFCRKHDCPCCRKCIIESHNDCKDLKTIDEVVTNVKSSNAFYEIEKTLTEVAENLRKIRKNRQENLASLTDDRQKIETEIKELRIRINKHLDKIQEDMIKELQTVEENQRKEIQKLLAAVEQNESEIKDVQTTINNIKQHASDLQTFLTLKQMESKASDREAFIQSLVKDQEIKDVVLTNTMDATIRAFESTILTFGKVNVEERPSNIATTCKKESQAQTMMKNKSFSIERLKITLRKKVNSEMSGIFSCILLTDGILVVTGTEGLKIINTDGSFKKMDLMGTSAFDVTNLENNVIAVTTGSSVKVININKKQVLKTIQCTSDCYGIASKNGNLIICTRNGIRLLNWQNEKIDEISNVKLPEYAYVATYLDNIYFTNNQTHTVTCCNHTGTTLWQFKDTNILQHPFGISVDSNGSIYVGCQSHNVVVISRDVKQHRQLLTKTDGLCFPCALYFDQSASQLLVANYSRDVFIFDVSI